MSVVTHQNRPPKKTYKIKAEGRQALQEWLERPVPANLSRRAFVMRLILAENFTQSALIAHLRQRRRHIVKYRDALQELYGESETTDAGKLALDYGLAAADAELSWLDRAQDLILKEPFPEEVVKTARVVDAG